MAVHNYIEAAGVFPPGQLRLNFSCKPKFRGFTLFVYLLPYVEANTIYSRWDFIGNPLCNTVGCQNTALSANVIPTYVCPSDPIPQNPYAQGTTFYGITSYGGNGGTKSYPPPGNLD